MSKKTETNAENTAGHSAKQRLGSKPLDYRLKKDALGNLVLVGLFEWSTKMDGGTEWVELETLTDADMG